jgi:hypothetical protein
MKLPKIRLAPRLSDEQASELAAIKAKLRDEGMIYWHPMVYVLLRNVNDLDKKLRVREFANWLMWYGQTGRQRAMLANRPHFLRR